MAIRLAHHRRIAVAALFLSFVVATMLLTFHLSNPTKDQEADGPPAGDVAPVGAGVTLTVSSLAEWDAAVAAARPGDVIRLTATINARLVYRGDNDGGTATGVDGTGAAPIVITADPGVWIDPGSTSSGFGALDLFFVDHVHAVGLNVRNAQFGIRCLQCHGSAGAPIRLVDNTVDNIGHAGIHFAGHWSTHAPSSYGLIENNVITNTGMIHSAYGEGIYLGYGAVEWVDVTSDVEVKGNDISFTGAEGIDVKPGTRNIVVSGNYIHDLAPIDGGAISAHYVNAIPNPHPSQLDSVLVDGNRIWNLNLSGVAGSNDWAIWVGHGGVDVVNNVIWGLRDNFTATRSVRVRATQDFGPHPIRIENNTFWSSVGWKAEGSPSGAGNVVAASNIGVEPAGSEIDAATLSFVGPVPALGASGTADSGSGPGSGFALAGSSTTTTTAPTTTSAAPTTTTTAGSAPSSTSTPTSVETTTTISSNSSVPDSTGVSTTATPLQSAPSTTVIASAPNSIDSATPTTSSSGSGTTTAQAQGQHQEPPFGSNIAGEETAATNSRSKVPAFDDEQASPARIGQQPDPVGALKNGWQSGAAGQDNAERAAPAGATNQSGSVARQSEAPGPAVPSAEGGAGSRSGLVMAGIGVMAAMSLGWMRWIRRPRVQ